MGTAGGEYYPAEGLERVISMKEPWIVFYLQDKELCAITVRGSFPGEITATKEQLAAEHGCSKKEIHTEIIVR